MPPIPVIPISPCSDRLNQIQPKDRQSGGRRRGHRTRNPQDRRLPAQPLRRFAAFPSTLPLTGGESGGYSQVFRYDAADRTLDCASCNPTGRRRRRPGLAGVNGSSLTEAGQVFFNSDEPLALRDTDNRKDVYEWEPEASAPAAPRARPSAQASGDCLGLISTGSSPFNSSLLGVSANGTDAYFFTRDTLAPQDENGELVKIYDAREDGGFFVTPEPPSLQGLGRVPRRRQPAAGAPASTATSAKRATKSPAAKCKKGFVEKHGTVRASQSQKHHDKQQESITRRARRITAEARNDRPRGNLVRAQGCCSRCLRPSRAWSPRRLSPPRPRQ